MSERIVVPGNRAPILCQPESRRRSISALNAQRNNLAPISKLPVEILAYIFEIVNEVGNSPIQNMRWADFARILHVCRKWRSVAHEWSRIWSRIIFEHPAIVEEMLTRSKTSPLSIRLQMDDSSFVGFMNLSGPLCSRVIDITRIGELHVTMRDGIISGVLPEPVGCTADKMRSLRLCDAPDEDNEVIVWRLLSIPMVHLQHLEIKGCPLPWDSLDLAQIHHGFSELITLSLSNTSVPSRKQFYNLLLGMSNLETLILDYNCPFIPLESDSDTDQSTATTKPIVYLPKLSHCSITGSTLSQCIDFQSHVSYPMATSRIYFRLTSDDPAFTPSLVDDLVDACGISKRSSFNNKYQNLFMKTDLGGRTQWIVLWDGPFQADEDDCPFSYPGWLMGSNGNQSKLDIQILLPRTDSKPSLLKSLSLPRLKGFCALSEPGEASYPDSSAWHSFFSRHGNIITGHFVLPHDILTILSSARLHSTSEPPSQSNHAYPLCLPNLTNLAVVEPRKTSTPIYQTLLPVLQHRCDQGNHPLQRLLIACPYNISHDEMAQIRKLVEHSQFRRVYQVPLGYTG